MKKFLSLLVAAVLMTTLVMPVTASATVPVYANLYVTDDIKVETIPSGWKWVGDSENGVLYQTTQAHPGTNAASTYYDQWTASNFDIPKDMIYRRFTDDVMGKTLDQCSSTSTNFCTIINQLDVTAPGIVEGEKVDDYPLSFTSTPEGASTGYDTRWVKAPVGEDSTQSGSFVEKGETFDKAYDYYLIFIFEANDGYSFTNDTICLVNGDKVSISHKYDDCSTKEFFKVDFKSDEPTTQAPTTTAAAATSPQTADAMNPLFYVLAIIALSAAATVTIFVRRRK